MISCQNFRIFPKVKFMTEIEKMAMRKNFFFAKSVILYTKHKKTVSMLCIKTAKKVMVEQKIAFKNVILYMKQKIVFQN